MMIIYYVKWFNPIFNGACRFKPIMGNLIYIKLGYVMEYYRLNSMVYCRYYYS